MDQLNYRFATAHDVEALIELRVAFLGEVAGADAEDRELRGALRDYFGAALAAGEFVSYVAEIQRQVIAASGMVFHHHPPSPGNRSGKVAYIMNMYTLPQYRGRGIATELLTRLIAHARQNECARAFLHALPKARSVYERAGFLPDDSEMRLDLIERHRLATVQANAQTMSPQTTPPSASAVSSKRPPLGDRSKTRRETSELDMTDPAANRMPTSAANGGRQDGGDGGGGEA